MSNFEGEEPEFGELDVPPEDSMPRDPGDETIEFEGTGDMLDLGDDVAEPAEGGEEFEAPLEPIGPDEGDALGEMGMAPPDGEFAGETAEEFAGETAGEFPAEGTEEFAGEGTEEFAAEEAEEEPEEEVEKRPGFLERLTKTSPYVVLLGISLVAILIGIFCWFMELKSYDYQIKPAQTSMAPAVQSAPPSTKA